MLEEFLPIIYSRASALVYDSLFISDHTDHHYMKKQLNTRIVLMPYTVQALYAKCKQLSADLGLLICMHGGIFYTWWAYA